MTRWALVALCLACGPLPKAPPPAHVPRIVTTERGPRGGRLVSVGEDGTRLADLTSMETSRVVDSHPAFSPDGRQLVFASSRGREFPKTSLWVMPATAGAKARRLTTDDGVERDPVWGPKGIVYASSRHGTFDLFFLPKGGAPQRLTDAATDELSPTMDGERVVYMALDRKTGRSTLWSVPLAGGPTAQLTQGPADLTPEVVGDELFFAAPVKGRGDTDIFVQTAAGTRRVLADEPYADQTGPVVSRDGRFVFATSLYRSQADGAPVLSSLVVLDRKADTPVWRALHDPVYVESRIGVAVSGALAADRLANNPTYLDALRSAVSTQLKRLETDRP